MRGLDLDEAAGRRAINERDQAPTFLLKAQAWVYSWLSSESRLTIAVVIIILAVIGAIALSSVRFFQVVFEEIDSLALVTLFLVNWLGNGGALVPIPGARFVGILMIFQQAALMPSWEVFAVAGLAMALGLTSYYLAGARTAQSFADGDTVGAQRLAQDTGMLDDEVTDFSPGAELDELATTALAGVGHPDVSPRTDEGEASAQTRSERFRKRFSRSLKKTQERAQPIIEHRGVSGMFLLCFAPTPMGTAAAYLGGIMRFGFTRYLLASFAAKYLLAGIIVVLALIFSEAAGSIQIP